MKHHLIHQCKASVVVVPSQLHHGNILRRVEVQFTQVSFLDVIEHVLVHSKRWSFALQLEDYHTTIMSCPSTTSALTTTTYQLFTVYT